jgi:hypothetical protein
VSVHVTIDARSKADAELIAAAIHGVQATAWRGYGVIRLRVPDPRAANALVPLVREVVEQRGVPWARIRVGDDETMIRRTASRPATGQGQPFGGRTVAVTD